jgi:hypothetical protein
MKYKLLEKTWKSIHEYGVGKRTLKDINLKMHLFMAFYLGNELNKFQFEIMSNWSQQLQPITYRI